MASKNSGEPLFHYFLGMALLTSSQYATGVRELEKALEIDPDFYPAHYGLGIYHTLMGEAELAEESFRRCRELAPDSELSYLGMGYLNRCRRWENEALEAYETALKKQPNDFKCHYRLFALYSSTCQRDKAISAMESALALCPYLPHYDIIQEQLGKYSSKELRQVDSLSPEEEERIRDNERVIFNHWLSKVEEEIDPAQVNLILAKKIYGEVDIEKYLKEIDRMAEDLGPAILLLKSPREKIDRINRYLFQEKGFTKPWIRGDPDDLFLNRVLERKQGNCVGLSCLYTSLGRRLNLPIYPVYAYRHIFCRYDDGRDRINIETQSHGKELPDSTYRLALPPPWVERGIYLKNVTSKELVAILLNNRGWLWTGNKMYPAAMTDFEEALNLTSDISALWIGVGRVSYRTKNYSDAIDYLEAALQLQPGYDIILYQLGKAYNRKWLRSKMAIQNFEEVVAVTHNRFRSFRAFRELGSAYRSNRDYEKSVESYQAALRLKPDSISAECGLAFTYRRFEKFDKARKLYREILEREPENNRALSGLGMTMTDLNDHEAAFPYFKKAVEVNPEDYYPHYRLGLCYIQLDDLVNATEQHRILEDLKPRYADKLLRAIEKSEPAAGKDNTINER
ncbi:MAG: tetratricopeptide repeat protein [Candidatus Auribacterota bacterium]|nr:tetratricopeptide repeat protein [Candidatus Auribacterota bacterium]